MSTKYTPPTQAQIAKLDAAVDEARAAHEAAVAEHALAVGTAEHAAEVLAEVEERAASGLEVNTQDHARLMSTVRLTSQRPARLVPAMDETREALENAKLAAGKARADVIAAKLPYPDDHRQAALDAVRKWREAVAQYAEGVAEINDECRALLGLETRNRFGQVINGFSAAGRRHETHLPIFELDKFDEQLAKQRGEIISKYQIRTRL